MGESRSRVSGRPSHCRTSPSLAPPSGMARRSASSVSPPSSFSSSSSRNWACRRRAMEPRPDASSMLRAHRSSRSPMRCKRFGPAGASAVPSPPIPRVPSDPTEIRGRSEPSPIATGGAFRRSPRVSAPRSMRCQRVSPGCTSPLRSAPGSLGAAFSFAVSSSSSALSSGSASGTPKSPRPTTTASGASARRGGGPSGEVSGHCRSSRSSQVERSTRDPTSGVVEVSRPPSARANTPVAASRSSGVSGQPHSRPCTSMSGVAAQGAQ